MADEMCQYLFPSLPSSGESGFSENNMLNMTLPNKTSSQGTTARIQIAEMNEMKIRVFQKFNSILGKDVQNLSKCHDIHQELTELKDSLEKSLSLASSEAPSKVQAAILSAEKASQELLAKQEQAVALHNRVTLQIDETAEVSSKLDEFLVKIKQLEHAMEYLHILKDIEDISHELEVCLLNKEDARAVNLFVSLGGRGDDQGVGGRLSGCHAPHLETYAKDTILYWHNLLKDKFSEEFDECLKVLKWPFVSSNISATHTPAAENIVRLQTLTEYLLQIQIDVEKPIVMSTVLTDFQPLCLPMMLLVRPLRKRFLYHFYGPKQTNRQDKPEWFLTQILTWIRDHENFVVTNIQPVVDRMGFRYIDTRLELMQGLVHLAVEKLQNDLDTLVHNEDLFTHLIDECLGFEKELQAALGYPRNQPCVLDVLTQAQYFVKWLSMEKKYATEKIDAILSAPGAWETLDPQGEDELKVTQVADNFLGLLTAIQDRYNTLTQPGHRLQFLELQLDLIDDFRIRLIQLLHEQPANEATSHMPQILNTLSYIAAVLTDWGGIVHYLHLYHYKCQLKMIPTPESPTQDSAGFVFDETLELLNRLRSELINSLSESVALDVQAKSRSYRKDKWFAMPAPLSKDQMTLSPTACPMLHNLSSRLQTLQSRLATPCFNETWRRVVELLDVFLVEEVVLQNFFNPGGAAQFRFDMERNLFPLFAQYTALPEKCFSRVKEACTLLTLSKGAALLLLESIREYSDEGEAAATLRELGVTCMTLSQAEDVLVQRTDLTLE